MTALENRALQRLEGRAYFGGLLVTLRTLLHQAALDHCCQTIRDSRRQGRKRLAQDCCAHLEPGGSAKRQPSCGCFVKEHTEGPQIAEVISFLATQNFWGHVGQSAH